MNLSELKVALQRYAGADEEDPLTTWINAGLHMFEKAEDWPFLIQKTSVSTTPGVATLSLPSDFAKPLTIKQEIEPPLEYWDSRRFDRDISIHDDPGMPEVYTLYGPNVLQLWRVPDAVYNFTLVYLRKVPDLVIPSDEPSLIPVEFHYAIVQGAAILALQAESEEDRAQAALAEFNDAVGRCLSTYALPHLGEPSQVVDTAGYFGL